MVMNVDVSMGNALNDDQLSEVSAGKSMSLEEALLGLKGGTEDAAARAKRRSMAESLARKIASGELVEEEGSAAISEAKPREWNSTNHKC